MKYITKNEWNHFEYADAHISEVQITEGFFHIVLDGVIILPENSANRDIRKMRANDLMFKIHNSKVDAMIREGYKVFDADGKLQNQFEDVVVEPSEYEAVLKQLIDGYVYAVEKNEIEDGFSYTFILDGVDENTYDLIVKGTGDTQEWERFLNV